MQASDLISRAQYTLNDDDVHWIESTELLSHANEGMVEAVKLKPDIYPTESTISMVTGTKQSIAATAFRLLDVVRNAAGNKRSVRHVDRWTLDAYKPEWANETAVSEVQLFTFDDINPGSFHVYPPNDGNGSILAVVSAPPTAMADVDATFPLNDFWAGTVINWMLYRAFAKDSDAVKYFERSQAFYKAFLSDLGRTDMVEAKTTPKE